MSTMTAVDMSVTIGSLKLRNPVMPASGTFADGLDRVIDFNRLGALVTKTITRELRSGNPLPRVVERPGSLINAIGIPSKGVAHFIAESLPYYAAYNAPLVVSISAPTAEGFASLAAEMSLPGVAAIEANISCPNIEEDGKAFAMSAEPTEKVTRALREATKLPFWVKLTPNTGEMPDVARAAEAAGADAVVVANTILSMAIDLKTFKPCLGNIMGGLSGPAIKPIILRHVYQCAKAICIPVIACGGIATSEDAVEYMLAGARAVQVGNSNLRPTGRDDNYSRRHRDALPAPRHCPCRRFERRRGDRGGRRTRSRMAQSADITAGPAARALALVQDDARVRTLADELFGALRSATGDGIGITRASYGPGESTALEIVDKKAQAFGLRTERDAGANLVVTLEGTEPQLPFLACGSHLDSVPQGGNFDGAAGVVAGLITLAGFKLDNFRPRRTIKLFGLRGEESARFGKAYKGSSALFGRLSAADLAVKAADCELTLGVCMRSVGVDVARIEKGEPLVDRNSFAAWVELHIEQGPVLVARHLPVGIVTGIRGNIRHRVVECVGMAGHSGAVPRWLRHDAMFATAELISHLDRHWRTILERGRDLVITAGVVGTDPSEHAIARIPGMLRFSFELRSQSKETLEAFYDLFLSECRLVEEERGVEFKLDRRLESAPAIMDPGWVGRLRAAARALGLPDEEIPSGAGHDAAVFANEGIPSAMIFVRNEHGSHNPSEAMAIEDFVAGVAVMSSALREAVT